jgi:hypothetical protein
MSMKPLLSWSMVPCVALENVGEVDDVLVVVVAEPGKTLERRKLLLW